ncbi:MAG: hypothetical protein KGZ39_02650 [Simkania sp.]|nr:hypothetical protein [Simkania sp.]
MKKDTTKKCLCDEPQCAKCLMVNCEDDDCLVHTAKAKSKYRNIKMTYVQSDTPDDGRVDKAFDILFEEVSKIKEDEEK